MSNIQSDSSFFSSHVTKSFNLQAPCDVAVVIPTIARATLVRAIESIYAQDFSGRIQILIGVDKINGPMEMLDAVCCRAPSQCAVQLFYPGYSTSVRHGGVWEARDGGSLRTVLSFLANAPLIAYLDDDNWWDPRHLTSLARAISPVDWSFSLRWFVHPATSRPICIDRWESVGPAGGIFKERFGGFVDPNCLMVKRASCAFAFPWWTVPLAGDPKGMSADRHVFNFLNRQRKGAGTGEATTYYLIDPTDGMHPHRLRWSGDAYLAAGTRPA